MNDDEVKADLGLHLAKAILSQVAGTRETISKIVVSICTVAIPAHLALLNLFASQVAGLHFAAKVGPLFCWMVSLLLAGSILFPRPFVLDFKRPEMIVDANAQRVAYARRVGSWAYGLALVGLVWMAVLFMKS